MQLGEECRTCLFSSQAKRAQTYLDKEKGGYYERRNNDI